MKTLIIFLALTFSVMFSSPSYAGWTKVGEDVNGKTFYVDYERIRKHDGYIYYWQLQDFLKPTSTGMLSAKMYNQGDCKLFRYKSLSYSFHKEPMGKDTGHTDNVPDKEWTYPAPDTVDESVLKQVCNR